MVLTNFHSKYIAHDLTRKIVNGQDRLSMSLFNASVDLNPHQIEAALFALQSPLSKGTILADEVGLGKTIEAGIILCQYWAERRRQILIITPASLRKQWALELEEKFNLPVIILDSKSFNDAHRNAKNPLQQKAVIIASYNFANKIREEIKTIAWDLVVIDEAHKLRNAYRPSNKLGQGIRWATEDCRKLLLTATPLQNSLLELYGLITLIDENIFGDLNAFRTQFVNAGADIEELRHRLSSFCQRTLRNQVIEYIAYTNRKAITRPFRPTDNEQKLYEAVSSFLMKENSYAIPSKQKHLTQLILRKLLASSSKAIAATFETMRLRLENLLEEKLTVNDDFLENIFFDEEIETELLDEILEGEDKEVSEETIDKIQIKEEIKELTQLEQWAHSIGTDTKTYSLLSALEIGFKEMVSNGAAEKALIFTESRRTQDYLISFLENNGFADKIVAFNGANNSPASTAIYKKWLDANADTGRISGSRHIDIRTALVEYFRDHAQIMIATEAAAEGINLQFCSLVVNYDLPWNPQRVEQRIGRCHRYGQKHDVVVVNFLNERNDADRRVLELLTEKFHLFSGVFGASDDILGTIESGVDFEKRILSIYQECRTTEEIEIAFKNLQKEMDEVINKRIDDTRKKLFENFDEDVHARLKFRLDSTKEQLDRFSKRFWLLSKSILKDKAHFNEETLSFEVFDSPNNEIKQGNYHLITKENRSKDKTLETFDSYLYRLNHPLGEYVIEEAKKRETPCATLVFDISNHPVQIHVVEQLKGKNGYLILNKLTIDSFEQEEYLLFSGFDEEGNTIDQETCEKLFSCSGVQDSVTTLPAHIEKHLKDDAERHAKATISLSLEQNNTYFNEAREKLEKWADDMVLSAEKALKDTKAQIKILQREARQTTTIDEQRIIQENIKTMEKQQRRQRQEIFKVEDEIMDKRDDLIDKLEKRLAQKTEVETLFAIKWSVR